MRKLERSLNLFNVVAISVGAMLGGEIFVLPAVAAQMTGPSLWFAYLAAALLVLPAALSQAELATAMPESGGAYLYIERAMGPLAGTISGIGLWLSLLLKSTFALVVLGQYLDLFVDAPSVAVELTLIVVVVGLNVIGVRKVGRVQTLVVALCFSALLGLVVLGASFDAEAPRTTAWMTHGPIGLLAAIGLVFVSYAGVTKIGAVAEEVRDPARNIPRGILISLLAMAGLYTAVAAILSTVFPIAELEGDATPIASLAALVGGSAGATAISITAVLALIAMANAGLLAASRFPFAMGRHRLAPDALQHVSAKFSTPVLAILITGIAMAAMLLSLDVIRIAKLASAFMIAAFVGVNASVLILRESGAQWYAPPFRAPMYPYLQVGGIVTGLLILMSMGTLAVVGLAIASAAGVLLYLGFGRTRVARLGVLKQMSRRVDLLHQQRAAPDIAANPGLGAKTVVTLFGGEPSPEALVHLGMTLAADERLDVLVLRDVPEQTDLSAIAHEADDRVQSLERRVTGIGEERGVQTRVDVVLTRDVRETVFDYVRRERLVWVVMGWRDRTLAGRVMRDPMEWLTHHMPCNIALFKDAGIRTYRRIMVLAEPGPHDALVTRTADDLARLFRAELTFVQYLRDDAPAERVEEIGLYQAELLRLCDQPTHRELIRGPERVAAIVHATARFDLLVMGAAAERPRASRLRATPEETMTEQAHCAVLRLRSPRTSAHGSLAYDPAAAISAVSAWPSFFVPSATHTRLEVAKKEQLFAALGSLLVPAFPSQDVAAIVDALWLREHLQNTGMGGGVAIPHAMLAGADRTRLAVVTLKTPVEYGGGERVDVVFCLVGPAHDRESHLRLLSTVARLVVQTDILVRLRAATDTEAAELALVRAAGELLEESSAGA